ncbi:MAG: hypothetical protein Q9195_001986 [Heterodermia aff. obscurata]
MSLRGHGESWNPGFWSMTWGTNLKDLAHDVRCVWESVLLREKRRKLDGKESEEIAPALPVLIGHSSGGGLAQYVLSEGIVQAEALVLCAAIPGFGGRGARVCIIAGSEDKLVGVQIPRRLAQVFRDTIKESTEGKKIDQSVIGIEDGKELHINGISIDTSFGVRFIAIEGAAHHFQNDVHQEAGARQLLSFLEESN